MVAPMSDIETVARQFIAALPHARALGLRLENISEGVAVISMPYDLRLVGVPETGVFHGGAVSFVRAVATDEDEDRPVAMATGAFTVDRGTR